MARRDACRLGDIVQTEIRVAVLLADGRLSRLGHRPLSGGCRGFRHGPNIAPRPEIRDGAFMSACLRLVLTFVVARRTPSHERFGRPPGIDPDVREGFSARSPVREDD